MANIKFENISDYRDIETLHMHQYILNQKGDVERFLKDQQISGRDNARTPMQWDATPNAGFTTAEPWIKINPDHVYINEAAQDADENSPLNYFRTLTRLRKEHPVLIYGKYDLFDASHEQVYCYTRTLDKAGIVVILNFSSDLVHYTIPDGIRIKNFEPLINNHTSLQPEDHQLILLPWQAVLFELL
jgi:oligo-1,6-glucosidase